MIEIVLVVLLVLLIAAVAACVWLGANLRWVRAERDELRIQATEAEQQFSSLQRELGETRLQTAELKTQLATADEKLRGQQQQFDLIRKQSQETFQALASNALNKASEDFLRLATERLGSQQKQSTAELEQRRQAIDAMLKPVRESLDKHAKAVGEIEKSREGAYHSLRQQLVSLMDDQKQLRSQTQNLVQALRRPEVRGRWGEMQLRRVAELAGMIDHVDFEEQSSTDTGEGRLRPDMVVHLPAGRTVVVDAKTPISAFVEAVECTDEETRSECLRRHVRHIEEQVAKLGAKGYAEQFDRSPDFVVLFIPGESFLEAAVRLQPQLIERAMNRNVVIATPTTLISLLKAVEMGWREQRIADGARKISQLGQELHERLATATGHVETLGKHLDNAVKSYNQFVGSFETRVLVSARKFKELGADSAKELPAEGEMRRVEQSPRELTSAAE